MISSRGEQAGDIMLVRLPSTNIMVINREKEERRVKRGRKHRKRKMFCLLKCPGLYS